MDSCHQANTGKQNRVNHTLPIERIKMEMGNFFSLEKYGTPNLT